MNINTKKILIFSLVYYPDFVAGAEVAIKEITDRISGQDIQFDMIALRMNSALPRKERIGNLLIHRIGWSNKNIKGGKKIPWYININKYAYLILGLIKAIRLHRRNNYDATWSMMATYNSFTAVIFKYIFPRVRFILTLQEGDPIPYIKRRALPLYPLFKRIFTRADFIQTISRYLGDWAMSMNAKCPIVVIPNGVDINRFSITLSPNERSTFRKSLGFADDDIVLVTSSRLVMKNAVDNIISSLGYLDTKIKLLVLGNGDEEIHLKNLSQRLGLQDRVNFFGFVDNNDLPRYLVASDIFVRPSRSEGLGISFLEAMAARIPVIATPVGGIVDFLTDGETGLFCEIDNPKSIADKVNKIIIVPEARGAIVKNAYDLIKEKYDWDKIVFKMRDIFMNNSKYI